MKETEHLHSRISTIQELKTASQADFAREIGESQQTVSNHIRGRTKKIPVSFVTKIVETYPDVDVRWMLTGQGEPTLKEKPASIIEHQGRYLARQLDMPSSTQMAESVQVPIYEGRLSAGDGAEPSDRIVGFGTFLRQWLRQVLNVNPDRAFMAEVLGHSMRDILVDRDLAVGETCEQLRGPGVYAFHWMDRLYVKHIERAGPEKLHVISENPAFDRQTITADESDSFHLIGIVKGKITRPDV